MIVAEDANFYEHGGIDVPALKEALKYDLERKRRVRGASTITQQLAKNPFSPPPLTGKMGTDSFLIYEVFSGHRWCPSDFHNERP